MTNTHAFLTECRDGVLRNLQQLRKNLSTIINSYRIRDWFREINLHTYPCNTRSCELGDIAISTEKLPDHTCNRLKSSRGLQMSSQPRKLNQNRYTRRLHTRSEPGRPTGYLHQLATHSPVPFNVSLVKILTALKFDEDILMIQSTDRDLLTEASDSPQCVPNLQEGWSGRRELTHQRPSKRS